jgi:hypothetical protein
MRVLKGLQDSHRLPLDEVALYGAQIHAVVADAKASGDAQAYKESVRAALVGGGVEVKSIEAIAPSLEDVFISSVQAR